MCWMFYEKPSSHPWLFAGMSPYDLLARRLVNELDAVVLSVE